MPGGGAAVTRAHREKTAEAPREKAPEAPRPQPAATAEPALQSEPVVVTEDSVAERPAPADSHRLGLGRAAVRSSAPAGGRVVTSVQSARPVLQPEGPLPAVHSSASAISSADVFAEPEQPQPRGRRISLESLKDPLRSLVSGAGKRVSRSLP